MLGLLQVVPGDVAQTNLTPLLLDAADEFPAGEGAPLKCAFAAQRRTDCIRSVALVWLHAGQLGCASCVLLSQSYHWPLLPSERPLADPSLLISIEAWTVRRGTMQLIPNFYRQLAPGKVRRNRPAAGLPEIARSNAAILLTKPQPLGAVITTMLLPPCQPRPAEGPCCLASQEGQRPRQPAALRRPGRQRLAAARAGGGRAGAQVVAAALPHLLLMAGGGV